MPALAANPLETVDVLCGGTAAEETERRLAAIPEVLEVHHVAGEDCFLLKVRAPDTTALR